MRFLLTAKPLWLSVCVLLLSAGIHAHAQLPGGGLPKVPKPAKAPTPTTPKKWKVLEHRYDLDRDVSPGNVTGKAGDRATGRVSAGVVHKVRLTLPLEGKLTLRLAAHISRLPLIGTLRDPAGGAAATLDPVKGRPGLYQLDAFEIRTSGVWVVEVTSAHTEINTFELSTALELPTSRQEDLTMNDGRPLLIEIGGMPGRSLEELRLRSRDSGSPRQFTARLVDPDGIPFDLTAHLRELSSGDGLTITNLPLDLPGTWRLTLADRARGRGTVRLELRYRNPPAGRVTHRL